MLNNEELWDRSLQFARILYDASYFKDDKIISTKRMNIIEKILKSSNKKQFEVAATGASQIITEEAFNQIFEEIKRMPTDNVPYFMTLLRFQFRTF